MQWKDEEQILRFAQRLEGHTIHELRSQDPPSEVREHGGKGGFGQYLENAWFGLETNSLSRPDFYPVLLELKATPLKRDAKNNLVPKERLVLSIINYMEIVNEPSFDESHFLEKNASLLIVWYIHDSAALSYGDLKVTLADIWRCVKEDGPQVRKDWEYITGKIREGKADELSEGDTLFLGACTKGDKAESSYREQPCSAGLAKQRAFCFKIQYMRSVYARMLDRKSRRAQEPTEWFCKPGQSIEDAFRERFAPYIGKTVSEMTDMLGISSNCKNLHAMIARAIIGCKGSSFAPYYELQAGGVQLKIVRLERNGKPKESMSFPHIRYRELVNERWETSALYGDLTCKFIMPVFVSDQPSGEGGGYRLDRVVVWNMPEKDLGIVRGVWEETRQKVIDGDYGSFARQSDDRIVHIRPHARDSRDLTETPQGTMEKKKSFWLNASYIASVVARHAQYADSRP